MSIPDQEFAFLMAAAREGDPTALRRLHDEFAPILLGYVRQQMSPEVRALHDSADFTQAVWLDFFSCVVRQRSFDSPARLVAFLRRVARNLVHKARRVRGMTAEQAPATPTAADDPAEQAARDDEWQAYLRRLAPGTSRLITLLRQGHTVEELAARLGLSEKTLRRLLKACPPPPAAAG